MRYIVVPVSYSIKHDNQSYGTSKSRSYNKYKQFHFKGPKTDPNRNTTNNISQNLIKHLYNLNTFEYD